MLIAPCCVPYMKLSPEKSTCQYFLLKYDVTGVSCSQLRLASLKLKWRKCTSFQTALHEPKSHASAPVVHTLLYMQQVVNKC